MSITELGPVWQFSEDPNNVGIDQQWFATDHADLDWKQQRSGHGWKAPALPHGRGVAWYRVRLSVPEGFDSRERLTLICGAVDEDGEIWIDGQKAFTHTCESTGLKPEQIWNKPFTFDARPWIRPGREHLIAVCCYNRAMAGGLLEPVFLISSDEPVDVPVLLEVHKREKNLTTHDIPTCAAR